MRDNACVLGQLGIVRALIAFLLTVALAVLPVGGAAMAKPIASKAMTAGACHTMPDDDPARSKAGQSCAEHCMMRTSPPMSFGSLGGPSVANAILVNHASMIDAGKPRGADPPDTPPPRA